MASAQSRRIAARPDHGTNRVWWFLVRPRPEEFPPVNPEALRPDLLPSLGPVLSGIGGLLCALLWLATWRWRAPSRRGGLFPALLGGLLAALGLWFFFQGLGAYFVLATAWPLPLLALLGAVLAELLVWLYRFESRLVEGPRGQLLLALRLAALLVLLLVLLQPVRSFTEEREISREIAVLIDESESMRLSDPQLTPTQKLDRASLLGTAGVEDRPDLAEVARLATALDRQLSEELDALRGAPNADAALPAPAPQGAEAFTALTSQREALVSALEAIPRSFLTEEAEARLEDFLQRGRDELGRLLPLADQARQAQEGEAFRKRLEAAKESLGPLLERLAPTRELVDAAYCAQLDEATQTRVDQAAATLRLGLAQQILTRPLPPSRGDDPGKEPASLMEQLQQRYQLRFYRFAREIVQIDGPLDVELFARGESERADLVRTDLVGALEHVLSSTPPESLAGVLLLGDGRHNAASLPEDSLRQLALLRAPLCAVPIGADQGPADIALLSLKAPESIYLDDRVVITATVKLEGFRGETVHAELLAGDQVVERVDIEVSDVRQRSEIHFVHRPERQGIHDYRVQIQPDPREIFPDNNAWDFKVAVSDDRTNVLLVDSHPRWEFRYLRNLFHGRDKSVHLQYVLLHPDRLPRSPRPPTSYASASRPFGDSEATQLPQNAEEWRRFDVILLGDIPPEALSPRDLAAIEEAVTKRGSLLVCIAGPRAMPHAHDNRVFQNLLPVTYEPSDNARLVSPEPAYRLQLTAIGREHPVTSQSSSRALNEEIWSAFPPMNWRFGGAQLKDTAEVLAYALPLGQALPQGGSGFPAEASVEAAIQQLARQRELESENAVISSIRAGLGKVLLLHFDQTWRFRYGVGDVHHHRFWGQIMRWGAGPSLRSGNDFVRLGTDRLSYASEDPVTVTAKVLDPQRTPLLKAKVEVEVWKDGQRLRRQRLDYLADSPGLYETQLEGLKEEGEYQLKLVGDPVDEAVAASSEGPQKIETELLVASSRHPVELAELTADRDFLNRATNQTGGRLVELPDLPLLLDSFGAPKERLRENRNVPLWDKWPLLLLFFTLLTTEWGLRRKSGLV